MDLILNDKKYVVTGLFLKACTSLNLSLMEVMVLIYFENLAGTSFDINKISEILGVDEKEILTAFNNLMSKSLIEIEAEKDKKGIINETVSLQGINRIIEDFVNVQKKDKNKKNIFELFEVEFGRPLSPMEYEIINAWLDNNTSEEIILGALKEAVYNGAKSFRYIDKIIYDWNSKGFKTMSDVKNHFTSKNSQKKESVELFDYNWLEDEDGKK